MRPAVVATGTMPAPWVTCDEAYGQNPAFRDLVTALGLGYGAEVPYTTRVWLERPPTYVPPTPVTGRPPSQVRLAPGAPRSQEVQAVAAQRPVAAWPRHTFQQGCHGPMQADCAAPRVRFPTDSARTVITGLWGLDGQTLSQIGFSELTVVMRVAKRGNPVPILSQEFIRLVLSDRTGSHRISQQMAHGTAQGCLQGQIIRCRLGEEIVQCAVFLDRLQIRGGYTQLGRSGFKEGITLHDVSNQHVPELLYPCGWEWT